jgi:hypothetical protein
MKEAQLVVDVDGTFIPWILLNQPIIVVIEFRNTSTTDNKTVQFIQGVPPVIPPLFNVPKGEGVRFTLDGVNAENGVYAYTVSGGGSGNGGIEIEM